MSSIPAPHSLPHDHHEGSYLEGPAGFWSRIAQWATTVDHKKIGVMYLFAVLFMFFLGGMFGLLTQQGPKLRRSLKSGPRNCDEPECQDEQVPGSSAI